jgi:hypothetical protein
MVDHVEPVTEASELAYKAFNLRAVHGAGRRNNPCPVCTAAAGGKRIMCNALKGQGSVQRARRVIAERIVEAGGTPDLPGWHGKEPDPVREHGREW